MFFLGKRNLADINPGEVAHDGQANETLKP